MAADNPDRSNPCESQADRPAEESWSHEGQLQQLASYMDDLMRYRMPFGRYGPDNFPPLGKLIYELPHEYLLWFSDKGGGFPSGRLGELMQFVFAVKSAGAQEIFASLRDAQP
jgi:uncharacterized protein (DUF3820 family)